MVKREQSNVCERHKDDMKSSNNWIPELQNDLDKSVRDHFFWKEEHGQAARRAVFRGRSLVIYKWIKLENYQSSSQVLIFQVQ